MPSIKSLTSRFALTIALLFIAVGLGACGSDRKVEIRTSEQAVQSEPEKPHYYFKVYGMDADTGPGKEFVGACDVQDGHERLTLFSIHSPGVLNGGGKGGSNPPSISFSRSMRMQWKEGREGNKYQAQSIELGLRFETKNQLHSEKYPNLNQVAQVKFGNSMVPVFHVEDMTVMGVLKGYHAWFKVLETNQPPYRAGLTGDLYAHLHIRTIGRWIPDNNPWTESLIIDMYESFYTQPCFVDYFKKYMPVNDDASFDIVD